MLPNFFVVGAMKAGTTALYYSLKQHPEIYMSPKKEPNYFALIGEIPRFKGPRDITGVNRMGVFKLDEYEKLFRKVKNEKAVGEGSTSYLRKLNTAANINKTIPQAKIIAILRNPVERAFSEFMFLTRDQYEPCTNLIEAIEQEKHGDRDEWWTAKYLENGMYSKQLQRYMKYFPNEQVIIFLYEDLRNDWERTIRSIYQFLEVDESFQPIVKQVNVSGIPKSNALHKVHGFLAKPHPIKSIFLKPFLPRKVRAGIREPLLNTIRNVNLRKAEIPAEVTQLLKREFEDDISKLQELIQRDLSDWLN